ncbi:MAG: putative transposase [Limisphaerales bacterium]
MEALKTRREKVPRRVPVGSLSPEQVVKLAPEIQHLTNLVKMVAYQTESELLRQLAPHHPRTQDEGRTLLQSAFSSAADLQVTDKELRMTLAPLSLPHRSQAIAALCEELNKTSTTFPGSSLRLRYAVRPGSTAV